MNNKQIIQYLKDKDIICEDHISYITINRDSICANIMGKNEEDKYKNLLDYLKQKFNCRCYYSMKTDDVLFLVKKL